MKKIIIILLFFINTLVYSFEYIEIYNENRLDYIDFNFAFDKYVPVDKDIYVFANKSLNYREKPTVKSKILGKLKPHQTLKTTALVDDEGVKWYEVVTKDDKFAYIRSDLVIKREYNFARAVEKADIFNEFIEQYKDLGYLPEAMFNFITLLGWSPQGEDEIFSREEFIQIFDEKRLGKSPAAFDPKKLEWINNTYVKKTPLEEVAPLAIQQLQLAGLLPETLSEEQQVWANKLVALYHDQMSYMNEIVSISSLFFQKDFVVENDEAREVLQGETVPTVLHAFKSQLEALEVFDEASVMAAIKAVQKETGVKGKNLFMPIRVATSGQTHGPSLGQTIELLGKERSLVHLNEALALIQA